MWIYVDDDGPGIPPDQREEAFRPFVRLDNARNLDETGTGLGLAIALDIAHAHGGDIFLEDSPMGGLARGGEIAGSSKSEQLPAVRHVLIDGPISTTPPSASGKPSVSTSDMKGPIWRGGKLTTAATWRPSNVSCV